MPFTAQVVLADADNDAISNAPVGLDISKYFDVGNFEKTSTEDDNYSYQTNSATIYNNSSDSSDKHNGRVLDMAKSGDEKSVGAAWSKIGSGSDNYIDINKKQTVSVWLYFGSGEDTDPLSNGEGMSLVLQNDSRGTSAMGAGMQSLGSMGADTAKLKDIGTNLLGNWSWSKDSSSGATTNTPEQAAQTAVGNSIALNFKTEDNNLMGSKLQQPIQIGETPIDYDNALHTGGKKYLYYTLNSFDTPKGTDTPPATFPAYNDLLSVDFGNYIPSLKLGNTGSSYGLINLTYPGNSVSYKSLDLNNIRNDDQLKASLSTIGNGSLWAYITGVSNKGKALSTYQAAPTQTHLIDGDDENGNPIYWHHLTFTWNPAENGNPATISYDYNDKYPDGTTNTGQSDYYDEVKETIPVDPSELGNPTDGHVYWGLTGANNEKANYSKLAVFESIPALATATATASLTDNDLNKTITDDSTDNTVNNGDNLSFDYNLKWDNTSRENWQNIVSDLNLPTDVTYRSATITYKDANGNSSSPITISDAKGMTNSTLGYTLTKDLGTIGTNNGYTSADIVLNGTATNSTGQEITVSPAPATFKGDNAIETTSTPQFKIEGNKVPDKILKLTVSKDLDFQDINYQATKKYITRKNDFDLTVTSLRSPWKLDVATNGLSLNGKSFHGSLVYKKNQATTEPLTSSDELIAQDLNSYQDKTVSDLSATWTKNTGLLLEPDQDQVSPAGKYQGTLNWTLVNSITN